MKLKILGIGTRMPDWVRQGVNDYRHRLPRAFLPQLIEIPAASRQKNQPAETAKEKESKALLKKIDERDYVIALDISGLPMKTEELAHKFLGWQQEAINVTIVIGGPDGVSLSCLNRANMRWSLSNLTLPHTLVRVVLMEQLYRAWSINSNHPYHRY